MIILFSIAQVARHCMHYLVEAAGIYDRVLKSSARGIDQIDVTVLAVACNNVLALAFCI